MNFSSFGAHLSFQPFFSQTHEGGLSHTFPHHTLTFTTSDNNQHLRTEIDIISKPSPADATNLLIHQQN